MQMQSLLCVLLGVSWSGVVALRPKSSVQRQTLNAPSFSNFSEPKSVIPFLDPATSSMFGAPVNFDLSAPGLVQRIVGGSKASSTEAPFFTLLITWDNAEGVWKNMGCGGTVVSNRHVLTAAHCLAGRSGTVDAVFINAYDPFRGNPSVPYHFSRIKSVVIHADFDDDTNVNDVAIITLKRRIKDTDSFPPVRLLPPQYSVVNGHETRIYGFGRRMDNETAPVETLRAVSIPFISNEACQPYYPWRLRPDMICAGLPHTTDSLPRRDACTGDSGGPMTIIGDDDVLYQMGIVSWGEGCGLSRKPGVYASVPFHYAWIQNAVCNGTSTSTSSTGDIRSSLCDVSLPAVVTSRTTGCGDALQAVGSPCHYGGECCSGICSSSSFYYKRVCQEGERSVQLRFPNRRLRSRRAQHV